LKNDLNAKKPFITTARRPTAQAPTRSSATARLRRQLPFNWGWSGYYNGFFSLDAIRQRAIRILITIRARRSTLRRAAKRSLRLVTAARYNCGGSAQ
jgi:hypothetical protein